MNNNILKLIIATDDMNLLKLATETIQEYERQKVTAFNDLVSVLKRA